MSDPLREKARQLVASRCTSPCDTINARVPCRCEEDVHTALLEARNTALADAERIARSTVKDVRTNGMEAMCVGQRRLDADEIVWGIRALKEETK